MSDKTADFNYFLEKLVCAAAKIESHYFQLPIAGLSKPAFLERVYCYELYHQLRCILKDDFLYSLHAEVDKTSNPKIRSELGRIKPDFIVHVPGKMSGNLAAIEVKSIKAYPYQIRKDLEKLKGFLDLDPEEGQYHKAIILIYGSSKNSKNKIRRIRREINNLLKDYPERVLLLWQKRHKEEPEVV